MERDRVISVSLTEAEWQAFVSRHPQPVDWIREQILAQLEGLEDRKAAHPGGRSLATSGPWSTRRV